MDNHSGDRLDSAVLVPVFRDGQGELRLLVVRRTEYGVHGGQLAFPGGKCEADDQSMLDTALREAHEEVRIDPGTVELLEELPPLDTMTTGYLIYPFLAKIQPPDEWRLQEREIAEVFEVSVEKLANPEIHGESIETFPQLDGPVLVRYYRLGSYRLWGATYRILSPLVPRLLAGEWDV